MMTGLRKLFGGLFRGAATSIDPVHPRDPALAKMFGLGSGTFSGVDVTQEKVLALPAIKRGVEIISNGMMKTPFYVFEEREDGHTWDQQHPSWTAVSRKPNRDLTDGVFRQTLTSWAMTWGNAHAYIDRPNWPRGPIQLIPLLPDRTWNYRVSSTGATTTNVEAEGMLRYATRVGNEVRTMDASEVLHIHGIGPNPYTGYNIVELLKETFGGALAGMEFGHRFFGQGANPAGFIEMPNGMDEEAEERFIKSLQKAAAGLGKSHKLALLEEGAKFHKWTIDPEAAQFLETKQLDVRMLAMAIGIKVHKLIDGANTSYSSLEQANQEHKDDDVMPWICRWREEMEDKLLTEQQKETLSHSIDVDDEAMTWVPFRERASGVVELYNNGLIDKDEGRRKVNFGPSQSGRAKEYKTPANITFEGDAAMVIQPEPAEPIEDGRLMEVSVAYMDKLAYRLANDAKRKCKNSSDFDKWLTTLKPEAGPVPLQPSIDQLYAYVHTESKNCLLSTVTDTELRDAVSVASVTFTAHAATITAENLQ